MSMLKALPALATLVLMAAGALAPAHAAEPLKIGMVLPMSGPFAAYGIQILNGAQLYLEQHGDTVANRKIQLIVKDDTGVAPDVSKRQAQQLIIKDKVSILAGFGLTPAAFAVAPLSVQAKVPMVIMNAATLAIPEKSPYIVRTSQNLPQVTAPIATWASQNGIKTVYTVVADYGPGHDAQRQFRETFSAGGGTIVGEVRTPVKNPDFSPYLQKIKDIKPDAVFLFVPAGEQGLAFIKDFKGRGLAEAGIQLIATGDLTDEDVLDAMGEAAEGVITSFHYSEAHDSPQNNAYTTAYYKAYPDSRPNFMSVAGYDGMHLIFQVLEKTQGDASGQAFVDAAKGQAWTSPRGEIHIDPETRDIVQTVYIRKVEKRNGKLQNIEFDHIAGTRHELRSANP